MHIGIHVVRYDTPDGTESIGPTLAATARTAEDAGVSRFTSMDHWFQMEQMALRLVARCADACNLFAFDADEVAHELDVLTQHRLSAGRNPDSVERTIVFVRDPFTDVDAFVAAAAGSARMGVTTIDLVPSGDPVAFVERVGTELIPRLGDLDEAA